MSSLTAVRGEENDAGFDRLMDKPNRLIHARNITEVMAANSEGRYLSARASEFAIKHVTLARGRRRRLSS